MYTSWVIITNLELQENKMQPEYSWSKTLLCSLSGRMAYFSLKVRGEFIKLGLFQCSIGQCHLSLSSIKNNLAINSPVRKELVIFGLGETHDWNSLTPGYDYHWCHPLVTRNPEQRLAVNKKRRVIRKAGRADVIRGLGFWPRGHSITSTERQEHRSKNWIVEENKLSLNS